MNSRGHLTPGGAHSFQLVEDFSVACRRQGDDRPLVVRSLAAINQGRQCLFKISGFGDAQLLAVERVDVGLHTHHLQRHFLDEHALAAGQVNNERVLTLALQRGEGDADRGGDEQEETEEGNQADAAKGHGSLCLFSRSRP